MKEDIRNVQKMERKWKEGTSDHAGGSLKWNDDDLLLCGDGKMCCGNTLNGMDVLANANGVTTPRMIINKKWPLLKEDK